MNIEGERTQSIWLTETAVCLAEEIHKHDSCSLLVPSEDIQLW